MTPGRLRWALLAAGWLLSAGCINVKAPERITFHGSNRDDPPPRQTRTHDDAGHHPQRAERDYGRHDHDDDDDDDDDD